MRNFTVVAIVTVISVFSGACSGSSPSEDSEPASPAATNATEATDTRVPRGQELDGLCDWFAGQVVILSEVTCDELFEAGKAVIVDFESQASLPDGGIQLLISRVCTGSQGDAVMTYEPHEDYMPALADAVVGDFCPGDRENIVAAS